MIKAIFFDIDGTLISAARKNVPLSTRRSLQKLRKEGIKTVVATGRDLGEVEKLPIRTIHFDGYITLNGQLCYDEHFHTFSGHPIDDKEMEILSGMFKAKDIPFILINQKRRYINYVDDTVVDVQEHTNGTIPDVDTYHGEKIYQICAFVTDRQKKALQTILDECQITSWNDMGIDIIPKGGGKAKGIEDYLRANGMTQEEIMAFGDGENDIEMLQFAGIGVAMGNASDKVKAKADYVTDTVENNGIEQALRHFGLL